jgi:hypothetical protein
MLEANQTVAGSIPATGAIQTKVNQMRKVLKEYPQSICYTCLVKAACHVMCYEQAEQMKNNLDIYFRQDIADILRKTKQNPIELIMSAENTYEHIRDKKEDEYG